MTSRCISAGHGHRDQLASFMTLTLCLLLTASAGCHAIDFYTPALQAPVGPESGPPRELSMVCLPAYRVEPPDVLGIEVLRLVPRGPYRIAIYDVLQICASGTILDQPIDDYYLVDSDGSVSLGAPYGTVRVAGMTTEAAVLAITSQLQQILQHPAVTVSLSRSAGTQQVTGIYAVQSDGRINLRSYGMVYLAGKTVSEVRLGWRIIWRTTSTHRGCRGCASLWQ